MGSRRQFAATTTAWGDGDELDVALERIAATCPEVSTVEIAIGARPVNDPAAVLDRWAGRFTFVAHHTAPIAAGRNIRPDLHADPGAAAAALRAAGIASYSGHPPARRYATDEQMWSWAMNWWQTLAANGIAWSVETMYTPRTRREQEMSGGYHLAHPEEVWSFCDRAVAEGWEAPLLVDAAHLHIGWCADMWSEADIVELLAHAPSNELHVSSNDGRRDTHDVAVPGGRVWRWVAPHLDRFALIVDEGRRGVTPRTSAHTTSLAAAGQRLGARVSAPNVTAV